jgi:hypothetical protein
MNGRGLSSRSVYLFNDPRDNGLVMAMGPDALFQRLTHGDMASDTVQAVAQQYLRRMGLDLKYLTESHVLGNGCL